IADQQRRLHGARRNIERLKQEGADDEGDDQGVKDHPQRLGKAAFLALLLSGHAHRPLVGRKMPRDLVAAGRTRRNQGWRCTETMSRVGILPAAEYLSDRAKARRAAADHRHVRLTGLRRRSRDRPGPDHSGWCLAGRPVAWTEGAIWRSGAWR